MLPPIASRRLLLQAMAPLLAMRTATLGSTPTKAAPLPTPQSSLVSTRSGLRYVDFDLGNTEKSTPRYGQLLRFHYVGYTLNKGQDGLQAFDSTYSRDLPYLIKHGNGFTCQGIEEALHSMHPGGRRRIVLPPNLGYTGDKGPMPPAARDRDQLFNNVEARLPIVFDLELLSVMDDLLDRGEYDNLDADDAKKFFIS